jgi:hypothetical protein
MSIGHEFFFEKQIHESSNKKGDDGTNGYKENVLD